MSNEPEEWADGAESFFDEFASSVSQEKSQRRKNVEAQQADALRQQAKTERLELDKAESAAEARRRITAAVVSRASAKEIEAAARNAKKLQKTNGKNKSSSAGFSSSAAAGVVAGSSGAVGSLSTSAQSPGRGGVSSSSSSSSKPHVEGESTSKLFGKKRDKVNAKFARKAARKTEVKENQIKYRRVLRKQRR